MLSVADIAVALAMMCCLSDAYTVWEKVDVYDGKLELLSSPSLTQRQTIIINWCITRTVPIYHCYCYYYP